MEKKLRKYEGCLAVLSTPENLVAIRRESVDGKLTTISHLMRAFKFKTPPVEFLESVVQHAVKWEDGLTHLLFAMQMTNQAENLARGNFNFSFYDLRKKIEGRMYRRIVDIVEKAIQVALALDEPQTSNYVYLPESCDFGTALPDTFSRMELHAYHMHYFAGYGGTLHARNGKKWPDLLLLIQEAFAEARYRRDCKHVKTVVREPDNTFGVGVDADYIPTRLQNQRMYIDYRQRHGLPRHEELCECFWFDSDMTAAQYHPPWMCPRNGYPPNPPVREHVPILKRRKVLRF